MAVYTGAMLVAGRKTDFADTRTSNPENERKGL